MALFKITWLFQNNSQLANCCYYFLCSFLFSLKGIDACVGNPCTNGRCMDGFLSFTCDCTGTDFSGTLCQNREWLHCNSPIVDAELSLKVSRREVDCYNFAHSSHRFKFVLAFSARIMKWIMGTIFEFAAEIVNLFQKLKQHWTFVKTNLIQAFR